MVMRRFRHERVLNGSIGLHCHAISVFDEYRFECGKRGGKFGSHIGTNYSIQSPERLSPPHRNNRLPRNFAWELNSLLNQRSTGKFAQGEIRMCNKRPVFV